MSARRGVALGVAIGLGAGWAACATDPGGWVVESGDIGSGGGAASVFEPYGDIGGPVGPGAGRVGAPCEAADECATGYCMTTEQIAGIIAGAEVADGYCSDLGCALDGADGRCTADMGGTCFSLYAFLGPDMAGMGGICLRPCTDDRDCRTDDDNVCFDAETLVADGLLSREVIDQYYANGTRGCMPKSVVDAAIAKLSTP